MKLWKRNHELNLKFTDATYNELKTIFDKEYKYKLI